MKKALSLFLSILFIISSFVIPTTANAKGNGQDTTNPVIDGFYADPDIDYFDHKYWIFPTTDGSTGEWWGNTTFSAFSSEDLVNWTNEGVVLDVKADSNEEAGTNVNGIQIGYSSWSNGSAWAPSIEKIGDKYFLFYVGRVKPELLSKYSYWVEDFEEADGSITPAHYVDDKAIGVAVADSPVGPYVAYDEPLFYGKQVAEYVFTYNNKTGAGYTVPSVIDPSVFVDTGVDANKDGQDDIYVSFGNWTPMLASITVDGDKITIDNRVFRPIKGILWGWWQQDDNGFMESIVIFKRSGIYYYTWSVAGTANIGYRVAYGTSSKITNEVTYKGTLLQLDPDKGIFGTGHQSILCNPIDNNVYICYHRLHNSKDMPLEYNPENGDVGARGNFRETCIDKINFDVSGTPSVKPTHSGVDPVTVHSYKIVGTTMATCTEGGKHLLRCSECEKESVETYTKPKGHGYRVVKDTATCTKNGVKTYQCIDCKKEYTEKSSATGHKYTETVKRYNNCQKSDEEIRICSKCGLKQVAPLTPIRKHVYTSKVTKAPTSSATGVMTYSCKNCSYKYTKTIAKLDKASISSLTAKSKGFTVSWKKVSSATGYQVQYSTSSNFSSPKTVTITKNSSLSKSVTKLTAKKKYYVRIRTYRTINGKKYYSSWSTKKYVTTKK